MAGREADALTALPKDCLVRILSFLGPVDTCRASCVCRALRSAADSHDAWEPNLPKNYSSALPLLLHDDPATTARGKELYLRLRSGILLENGTIAYWVDLKAREGCFMLSARALTVVWGDDERYWHWVPLQNSWFREVALLNSVCWLEVYQDFEAVFQPGSYTVSFRLSMMAREWHPQQHAGDHRYARGLTNQRHRRFAWEFGPVKFSLSTSNGYNFESERYVHDTQMAIAASSRLTPARTLGTWNEFDIGEFSVDCEMPIKLQARFFQTDGGQWKSGLALEGLKIQPSQTLGGEPI